MTLKGLSQDVLVTFPVVDVQLLDELVKEGRYLSRNSAIRTAVNQLLLIEGKRGAKKDE